MRPLLLILLSLALQSFAIYSKPIGSRFTIEGFELGLMVTPKSLASRGLVQLKQEQDATWTNWRTKNALVVVGAYSNIVEIRGSEGLQVVLSNGKVVRFGDSLRRAKADIQSSGLKVEEYVPGRILWAVGQPSEKGGPVPHLYVGAKDDRISVIFGRLE